MHIGRGSTRGIWFMFIDHFDAGAVRFFSSSKYFIAKHMIHIGIVFFCNCSFIFDIYLTFRLASCVYVMPNAFQMLHTPNVRRHGNMIEQGKPVEEKKNAN